MKLIKVSIGLMKKLINTPLGYKYMSDRNSAYKNWVNELDSGAVRKDEGKTDWVSIVQYMPERALVETTKVWEFGAKKYSKDNWRKGMKWSRVLKSLLRHAIAIGLGQFKDPETGLPHAAHIMCNACMLLEYEVTHPELNDLSDEAEKV